MPGHFHAFTGLTIHSKMNTEILPGFKSIHLTLCGSQAGRPLCDVARTDSDEQNGVKFLHAVYAPKMVFTDARLCAGCLEVWNSCEVQS